MSLSRLIETKKSSIFKYIFLGKVKWDDLLGRLREAELTEKDSCNDEQVWTFLACCAYAMRGPRGVESMARLLTEGEVGANRLWIEVLPYSPRLNQGNTNLDLAFGNVSQRINKKSGIELHYQIDSAICFCDFKWLSDISLAVTHDPHRNQLVRVIENAMMFSDENARLVHNAHVTLVTPRVFKTRSQYSRLYQYKWDEYQEPRSILGDLQSSNLTLRAKLPDPAEIVDRVQLHWISYEDLINEAPESDFKENLLTFFNLKSFN